jgi:hypothetical protein
MSADRSVDKHDYAALCRSLAAWLIGESQGAHRELKRGETADRLLEIAAILTPSHGGEYVKRYGENDVTPSSTAAINRGWLSEARCPNRNCDDGRIITYHNGEAELEQCQWCEEKAAVLNALPSAIGEPECRALYDELLYAVSRKHQNESRHETALRYIRQAEQSGTGTEAKSATKS